MAVSYKRLVRYTVVIAVLVYIVAHNIANKLHYNQLDALQQLINQNQYDIKDDLKMADSENVKIVYKDSEGAEYERENAALMSLTRNEDLLELTQTVLNYEDRFNRKFKYDWIFVNNEPFSDHFIKQITNLVSGNVYFETIPKEYWDFPDFIDKKAALQNRIKSRIHMPYGASESYRFMCRFFSGFFYKLDLVKKYEFIWRVEPETKLLCDVNYDVFKFMKSNNKVYGFSIAIHEYENTIPNLWKHVKEFIKLNPQYLSPNNLMKFISDDKGESYNLCHFWTNFEIVNLNFFHSQVYSDYFNFLDKNGGFFYERWGDAPIHSIAVSLFLDKDQVHFFDDVGYFHKPNFHCPIDDNVWKENKCNCDQGLDMTFRDYSCVVNYYDADPSLKRPIGWQLHQGNGQYFD